MKTRRDQHAAASGSKKEGPEQGPDEDSTFMKSLVDQPPRPTRPIPGDEETAEDEETRDS
jgi:hypothetical protein